MEELDEVLQHFGVKGMRWGVSRSGQNGSKKVKKPGAIRKNLDSLKRELQWNKKLKNVSNMSTKDIKSTATRVQMENDLKKLSRKRNVGSDKDKDDYLVRGNMSDQELTRKIGRLRAKDNLDRVVREASKEQMDLGKEILTFVMKTAIEASKD